MENTNTMNSTDCTTFDMRIYFPCSTHSYTEKLCIIRKHCSTLQFLNFDFDLIFVFLFILFLQFSGGILLSDRPYIRICRVVRFI